MTKHTDEIARLYASEIALCKRLLDLEAEQPSIAGAAFDAVLDGVDLANIPATASGEVVNIGRAIVGARERRRRVIQEQMAAEAAALRSRAAKLRKDADKRAEKTDALLAELEAHEEVTWLPVRPPQRTRPLRWNEIAPSALSDRPARWLRPRTQLQRREAEALESQARSVERRPISESGSITAASAEAVLERLEQWPADEIAPRYDELSRWLDTNVWSDPRPHIIAVHWNRASIAPSSHVRLDEVAA